MKLLAMLVLSGVVIAGSYAVQHFEQPAPAALALIDQPPDQILIGPFRWNVRYVKLMPEHYGMEIPAKLELQIDPGLAPDQTRETLAHEVLHACIFVGNRGTKPSIMATDDEFIEASAPTLMQVMHDNPALVAYLARR